MVFVSTISYSQQDTTQNNCEPCRKHPEVIGPSFVVHGAMRLYNGMPSVRIWLIGTKRILGVSEGQFYLKGYCNLPKWLEPKLSFETDLIGDFVLYSFTPDKKGVMRFVCVDTAYNLKVIKK